ncbi:MAG: alpha-glucuronidase family glycosyl hydrolase, partial [Limisphaerales bacterium]
MKIKAWICLFLALGCWPSAAIVIATHGRAEMVIVVDPAATPTETFAARELAATLRQITGADFEIQTNTTAPARAIVVGTGAAARGLFPDVPFDQLGGEELVMRAQDGRLLLSGGRPRGTLYAVSRFLQEQCGVRWWTPWATSIPRRSTLRIGALNVREKPAF